MKSKKSKRIKTEGQSLSAKNKPYKKHIIQYENKQAQHKMNLYETQ